MELKNYQKDVIGDLSRYLSLFVETQSASKAYKALWEEKGVPVGTDGLPDYSYNVRGGVPDVCLKVPTGGGKTFLAANAIKTIYDAMPGNPVRAVVWLVPSDAILTQTYGALTNPDHPYRRRINVDFSGRVEVYSKDQLLNGQNFNPTAVAEQLSIFILSYDSFRAEKKEGRKAFQENGNLASFPKQLQDRTALLPNADETALIQVIRSFNPIVIVDESHHAKTKLSLEMLENFNPCFVLDLTATPTEKSNIISFVDAAKLKLANMVKLPVIVYNRRSQNDVYADAINMQRKLETQARDEQARTGRYIRPIVLFQAQPRTGEESVTYEKIKKTLMEAGVPEAEIAIKTGDRDELKKVDLLSRDCPVRYIITVNALKEGWDCPFAYVLATVANRSSPVEVEQILGRVLRLPYAQKNGNNVLNISYVLTSSSNFAGTLNKVVEGLNHAGFSRKDCRTKDAEEEPENPPDRRPVTISLVPQEQPEEPEVDVEKIRERIGQPEDGTGTNGTDESDRMLVEAENEAKDYDKRIESEAESAASAAPPEVRGKMKEFKFSEAFAEEAAALRFPQFMLEIEPNMFSEQRAVPLELEHLEKGFTLRDKDAQIDFSTVEAEIMRVDTDDSVDSAPKAWKLKGSQSALFKEMFNSNPTRARLDYCKGEIKKRLSAMNSVVEHELRAYVDRIVETMTEDQLTDMVQSPGIYVNKVEQKVKELLEAHRADTFSLWLEQGRIICRDNYAFPSSIAPAKSFSYLPNSLYTAEEEVNEYEGKILSELSSMENIKWWHRNISRRGFEINGPIHAYPDIIARTKNGVILMIEAKGDHLDNTESRAKAGVGKQWADLAGANYRYYMVFQSKKPEYPGAVSYDRFMEIVKGL